MRLYRLLLHLYPRSFRHEYGGEMAAVFAERWRSAGPGGRVLIWLGVVPDVLLNATAAHWDLTRQDLRYGVRSLRAAPGFTATVVVILAFGLGANTAVFSVTDFLLIRPLPFPEADRLATVMERTPGYDEMELSPGNYRDWKRMNRVAASIGTYTTFDANVVDHGTPERIDRAMVSADLFPTLGIAPLIGHGFSPGDDIAGAPGTVILSYAYWQTHFGSDPSVVGRSIVIDDQPYTVLGVMPPEFRFPSSTVRLWTPQRFAEDVYQDRTDNFIIAVARLRSGVTIEQARADFVRVAAQLEAKFPDQNARTSALVTTMRGGLPWQSRVLLLALGGAALCVLLIVCANIANLLIARAMARRRELAVRTALGAGRERIVRQLVTESLVLAAAGGALGVLAAVAGVPLLTQLVPADVPIAHPPSVDVRVLLFAAGLTLVTGVAFGLVPVLRLSRGVDMSGLAEGVRAGSGTRDRLRRLLVVVEIAASVVLLVSTGLLLRALMRVQAIDPGFRTSGVLTLATDLPHPRYDPTTRRASFYDRVLAAVRALPGVRAAGYISGLPMVRGGGIWAVGVTGQEGVRGRSDTASLRFITPGYFAAMGIPLERGRDVRTDDTPDRRNVAVVSESFVRRYWPDQDPIDQTFTFAFAKRTVVGVVGDVRMRGLEQTSEPQVYLPYRQVADGVLVGYFPNDLAVRTAGATAALIEPIRAIVHRAAPDIPVSDVRTTGRIVALDTASRGVQLRVIGLFAGLALLLAGIGVHGLLSFAVSQRTHEFGVRMALGASPRTLIVMVAREGLMLVLSGLALGGGLAYGSGRALQAMLAGVPPDDAATFMVAIGVSAVLALSGSLLPAVRATRVDPVRAIRQE
jgi:putative ABC transport system permease protein